MVRAGATKALTALAVCVSIALALWCIVYAQGDTEVFTPVHGLACRYPMAHLNTFEQGCDAYLIDFGLFRYHRAFEYAGGTSSLVYWPIWALWKSPYSFYLFGAALLALFSCGLAKALDKPARYALVPLCCFPLVYLFIQDSGPVRLALLSCPALALLLRGAHRDARISRQIGFGALAAMLVVVCVEDKPFYLLVAPTIFICAFALGASIDPSEGPAHVRAALRRCAPALATFGVIAAVGSGVVLFVGHTEGTTYFTYLRLRSHILGPQGFVTNVKYLFDYTLLQPVFARRAFGWNRPLRLVSTLSLVPAAAVLVYALWRANAVTARMLGWMGAAYAAAAVVAFISNIERAPHHFVFLHLPLVLLLMHAAGRNAAGWRAVVGYLATSSVLSAAMLAWHAKPQDSREQDRVMAYLSREDVAATHVISALDLYDQQSVFGAPSQLVVAADPLDRTAPSDPAALTGLARAVSRDILYVCSTCSRPQVEAVFAGTTVDDIDIGVTAWKLFNVREARR